MRGFEGSPTARAQVGAAPEDAMMRIKRWIALGLLLFAIGGVGRAQDVQGVEACTHEARMDRRTGCLQSNVEYLHGLIAKNAAEAQRKLDGAAGEISALKGEIGALQNEIAALRAALAAEQATLEKLQAATRRATPLDKPVAK